MTNCAGIESDQAEMIERMKAGGHILMIRHALAPGTGDPANFRIGDCSAQRNLDGRGRKQAKAIGDWLRSYETTPKWHCFLIIKLTALAACDRAEKRTAEYRITNFEIIYV